MENSTGAKTAFFFFHPDYTVGFGFSPNQLSLADLEITFITAGEELHLALKT